MSVYAINKVCWLIERSAEFRQRLREDPQAALAPFPLDPEEARGLREGDVVALFQRGAHPFLLQHLGRHHIAGLDVALYRQRITSLAPASGG